MPALYLGRGWFIHSTGSSDGVTLASLSNSSYWKAALRLGPARAQAVRARPAVALALRGAGRRGVCGAVA